MRQNRQGVCELVLELVVGGDSTVSDVFELEVVVPRGEESALATTGRRQCANGFCLWRVSFPKLRAARLG
jgi:hypothetical protein